MFLKLKTYYGKKNKTLLKNNIRNGGTTMSKWIAFDQQKPKMRQGIFTCKEHDIGKCVSFHYWESYLIKSIMEKDTHWTPLIIPTHIDLEGEENELDFSE